MKRTDLNLRGAPFLAMLLLSIGALGLPRWFPERASAVSGALEAPLLILLSWLACRATWHGLSKRGLNEAAVSATAPSVDSKRLAPWPMSFLCALVLSVFVILGQIGKSKKTFPFMPLRMYGEHATGAAEFLRYVGVSADGTKKRLNIAQLVPLLRSARLSRGLSRAFAGTSETGLPRTEEARRALSILRVLAKQHNTSHAQQPGERWVAILIYRVRIDPPFDAASVSKELIGRFPVDET